MTKRGLMALRKPQPGYNVARSAACGQSSKFEKPTRATTEDQLRRKSLKKFAASLPKNTLEGIAARDLAKRLRNSKCPATMASLRHVRKCRRNIAGAMWEAIDQRGGEEWYLVTIIVDPWLYEPDQLKTVVPAKLLRRFRSWLYRRGLKDVSALGCLAIDGEFDSKSGKFCIHIHGIVNEPLSKLIKELTKDGAWRARFSPLEGSKLSMRPVVSKQLRPGTEASAIRYVVKPFWSMRGRFVGGDGKQKAKKGRRLPQDVMCRWLLWADTHPLNTMTTLIGMRVVGGRLKPPRQD